jgi:hypothetical protein
MNTTTGLVINIVEQEWKQFDKVQNVGGRAACQDDWETFRIMRTSQFKDWPESLLQSYLGDLEAADAAGHNLIMEKYGRMMESTSPQEYERIKDFFPVRSPERIAEQERIIAINMKMDDDFSDAYPVYAKKGRRSHTEEDKAYSTSKETYMRGEMNTWSDRTFRLYADWIDSLAAQGINRSEMVAKNMVNEYGYSSVEDAEKYIIRQKKE